MTAVALPALLMMVCVYLRYFDGEIPMTITDKNVVFLGEVRAGSQLRIPRSMCIDDPTVLATVFRQMIDGVVYTLPSSHQSPVANGCFTRVYQVPVPKLPPGKYTYKVTNIYHMNPLRELTLQLPDVKFTIVK